MVTEHLPVPPVYERLAIAVARERELLARYGVPTDWELVCAQDWPCEVESGVVFLYSDEAVAAFARRGWIVAWSDQDGDVAVRAVRSQRGSQPRGDQACSK